MKSSLAETIILPQRKLIVASKDIDLSSKNQNNLENSIFILMVQESKGSAGGRGGGSGMRKISRIMGYRILSEIEKLIYDTSDEIEIDKFEIPYSAVAMDIVFQSGDVSVVQGVIDPDLIESYLTIVESKLT